MRHNRIGAVVCVSFILLLSSCSLPVREVREVSSEPITAILGAFGGEITLLEDELTDTQEHRIEGIRFVSGKLSGKRVVIAFTGIGKVNAAMTTTLLIEHFQPNKVIFTGIAGAVNQQLQPGDIVIAEKTAHTRRQARRAFSHARGGPRVGTTNAGDLLLGGRTRRRLR